LNDLAGLLLDRNRYPDAAPLYQRALAINDKTLDRNAPEVIRSLLGSATIARFQGQYVDAERFYRRALLAQETRLGGDHPDIAATLRALAGLYADQRRPTEAVPLYKRALAIYEKTSDPDALATALTSLAQFYSGQGRHADAEPYL